MTKLIASSFVTAVLAFLVLPVIFIVWVAFFDSSFLTFPPPGYTFHWFAEAARNPVFLNGFVTSLIVVAIASTISVFSGAMAAIVLVRYQFPGREALNGLLLSPLIIPNIVLGIALYIFFIAIADTLSIDLIASNVGLIIAHTMLVLPWAVRLIGANLIGMDRSIEEAACNLGAKSGTVFFRVTLPLMRGGIVAAALFSFIVSFENLELSLLIVSPGHTTLPIAQMQYLEFNMDPTIAAVSTVQILVIAALLLITDRFVKLSRIV
ncbi:MAG: ABC transporter permease [Alphaproteobacteria bacterium]|nr:MAG: ABC transporter permease [Alphaproteobacteria bacterium]